VLRGILAPRAGLSSEDGDPRNSDGAELTVGPPSSERCTVTRALARTRSHLKFQLDFLT
jgi:hypothetical protein